MPASPSSNDTSAEDTGFQSAAALSAGLASGAFSSVELLDHFAARCERTNPRLNAVVATDFGAARKRAEESDRRRLRGDTLGALDGLPITVKDAFQVVGLPATSGAVEMEGYMPTVTAVAVQRLIDGGVIIFGKTNLPRFAAGLESYNDLFGTTNNPWDLSRTPGGSSGGSAAATAAGLTAFELGSDIGGSIRTPAHFCGVFGHKPSYGLTQIRGHIPGPPRAMAETDMAVVGPLSRGAKDLAIIFEILAGPDVLEANGWQLRLTAPRHDRLEDIRVAAWLDDPAGPVDSEVLESLEASVAALEQAGATVTRTRPEFDARRAFAAYLDVVSAVIGAGLPKDLREALLRAEGAADPNDGSIRTRWQRGLVLSHASWLAANELRARLRYAWSDFFRDYDVLLTPPMGITAFPHNQQDHGGDFAGLELDVDGAPRPYLEQLFWPGLANFLLLPATVAPTGLSRSGLPVGIQIMSDYLQDRTTLRFAELTEEVWGGFRAPEDA